ncbi:MAG: hypothetical protein N2C14_29040, partial [Planctomycetales bacterium]
VPSSTGRASGTQSTGLFSLAADSTYVRESNTKTTKTACWETATAFRSFEGNAVFQGWRQTEIKLVSG